MKKFKFNKQTMKILCAGTALVGVLFMNSISLANSESKLQTLHTQQFVEWQNLSDEEKENTLMPRMFTTTIAEETLEDYNKKPISYRFQVLTRAISEKWYSSLTKAATYNQPTYHLKDDIKVNVKHQGTTNECWAFSTVTMLETNLALQKNVDKKFSPRHMDYATLRTFTDGVNPYGYNREAGDGGLAPFGLAYLTNGMGAVLESNMPFENTTNKIPLAELNKPVDTIATETVTLPIIMKDYGSDGTVTYHNGGEGGNKQKYTDAQVTEIRNMIKDHIVKYGAVSAVTAGNQVQYYSNPSAALKSKAYFCNSNAYVRDHAVTIVGWDDSYSRDNFTGAAKPKKDGAYICLNTYGTENFDKGYIYISYEDALIESLLYGIKSASHVDYDKLYQYNLMGENTALGLPSTPEGYSAVTYSRDSSKDEVLKYVGVSIPEAASLEIYVNPSGNSTIINGLKKVATTGVLEAGYHRIDIQDVALTANNFAIVVKQKSQSGNFYFSIEASVPGSLYSTIKGNPKKCFYSLDGYNWTTLSDEAVTGFDMKNTDLTIKAFTDYGQGGTDPVDPPTPDDPEVAPKVSLKYSTTSETTEPVTVTLISDKEIKITNNNGKDTYTFKKNGEFTFKYEYGESKKTEAEIKAKVDWIKEEEPPKPTDPEDPTNPEDPPKPDDPTDPQDPPKPDDPDTPDKPDNPDNPENPDPPAKVVISTKIYKIKENKDKSKDIYKIAHETTVKDFKTKIETNSTSIVVKDEKGNELKDDEIVKNGSIVTFSDGSTYSLIVRGDADGDGKLAQLDFSKFIAHYMNGGKYALGGSALKAIDMNCDGKIDLTDVSQMVDLYMNN